VLFFAFQILAFYFLPQITVELLFLIILFTVITMYGGGFATLPAFLGDLFGTKQLGAIHGLVLAGWAMAGIVGPTVYDVVLKATGSLDITLKVFSGLFLIAFVVSLLMKRSVNLAYKEKDKVYLGT
jgi:OFA family oxalate/formate antiporter-like MFS transporter